MLMERINCWKESSREEEFDDVGDIGERRNAGIVSLSRQGSSEPGAFSQFLERDWIGLSPGTESGMSASTN